MRWWNPPKAIGTTVANWPGIKATSSADQVKIVVNIAKELSLEPATPDEARDILNLKGLDKVNY
jgi:3,5-dioxohexanoate:acetyl-CoA acetone transferase